MRKLLLSLILLSCFNALRAQNILEAFVDKSPLSDKYIQASKYTRQGLLEYIVKKNCDMDSILRESVTYAYYEGKLNTMNFFYYK